MSALLTIPLVETKLSPMKTVKQCPYWSKHLLLDPTSLRVHTTYQAHHSGNQVWNTWVQGQDHIQSITSGILRKWSTVYGRKLIMIMRFCSLNTQKPNRKWSWVETALSGSRGPDSSSCVALQSSTCFQLMGTSEIRRKDRLKTSKNTSQETGERAQQLRVHTALAGDSSSVPSKHIRLLTFIRPLTPGSEDPLSSSGLHGHLHPRTHTHT